MVLGTETTRVQGDKHGARMRLAHVFTVRNGKMTAFEQYQDVFLQL